MEDLRMTIGQFIVANTGCLDAEAVKAADAILAIPELKKAIDFHEGCLAAFRVNGEFVVTEASLKGAGGVSAS